MQEKHSETKSTLAYLPNGARLPDRDHQNEIRALIVSPLWNYLSAEQRERWLDQFLGLSQ